MDEHCPHCGGSISRSEHIYWTPQRMFQAAQEWTEQNGAPPTSRDWAKASYRNPCNTYVISIFGKWGAFIAAAGYNPDSRTKWTRERIIEAFLDWTLTNGRWPTLRDWSAADETHPHHNTVRSVFGNWDAARRAAGYRGSPRAKLTLGRGRELVVSAALEQIAPASAEEIAAATGLSRTTVTVYLRRIGAIVTDKRGKAALYAPSRALIVRAA